MRAPLRRDLLSNEFMGACLANHLAGKDCALCALQIFGGALELLRQPVINGYFIAGSLVGPGGLGLVKVCVIARGVWACCAAQCCSSAASPSHCLRHGVAHARAAQLPADDWQHPSPASCEHVARYGCASGVTAQHTRRNPLPCVPRRSAGLGANGSPGCACSATITPDQTPICSPALLQELVQMESLAQVGVQLLLFTLGLEFSLQKLRAVRSVALIGGMLEIFLFVVLAGLLAIWIGASVHEGIFVGALVSSPPK